MATKRPAEKRARPLFREPLPGEKPGLPEMLRKTGWSLLFVLFSTFLGFMFLVFLDQVLDAGLLETLFGSPLP